MYLRVKCHQVKEQLFNVKKYCTQFKNLLGWKSELSLKSCWFLYMKNYPDLFSFIRGELCVLCHTCKYEKEKGQSGN